MINKRSKSIIFGIIIILFLTLFFINSVSSVPYTSKVSEEVYEKLERNEEVPIIIKIKSENIFRTTSLEAVKDYIVKKLKKEKEIREYKDLISLSVSKEELEELEKNSNIESIAVSHQIKAFLQDSVPLINASIVWPIQISEINTTGIDETICIIDTGINSTHPDLIGKNKTCIIDCYNKNCVENCSIGDDNGHGTHVAGIAAASGGINGVAINVSLIGVKVLDSNGDGHPTNGEVDLTNALDWCIQNRNTYNISIISMSLGTTTLNNSYCDSSFTSTWTRSINNATFYNISVIAATGNDGNKTAIASPACIQNTTAVGATTKTDVIANYSNRNNITDLVAPGGTLPNSNSCSPGSMDPNRICSTYNNGEYIAFSGTSMATPHVAGAFTLIRQFFRLQNGRVPTPNEIKNVLNNTGKRIDDSAGSGYNFTRIDVFSAIISLDNVAPNVSLISPENNTLNVTQNQTFSCNATDVVQLKNITLQVWDSLGNLYYNSTNTASGSVSRADFNVTLDMGNYKWNCLVYDANSNKAYANSNYTLYMGNTSVSLSSPANNTYTNTNQTNFTCLSQTANIFKLTNITFMIWNLTSLVNSSNLSISGTSNSTTFQYNLTIEDSYHWNCLVYNNVSESAWAESNFTITYDITKPNITLISPSDGTSSTTTSYNFTFNVSDTNNISNCTLILDGSIINSLDPVSKTSTNGMYNSSLAVGSHSWSINCTDVARNVGNSSSWGLTITSPPQQQIISSGGGGTVSTAKEYIPTIEQVSQGYTQELKKDDKIKFTFFDEKTENHTLTIADIGKDYVNVTIQSNLIKLVLGIGQSAKLNLTSADYYDLYVKLNSISNNKASLTIQTIHEEIPKPKITGQVEKTGEEKRAEEEDMGEIIQQTGRGMIDKIKNILIVILVIGVLILLAERIRKEKRGGLNLKGKNKR